MQTCDALLVSLSTFLSEQTSTSHQPAVLLSQNKSASAISHQPNEQAVNLLKMKLYMHLRNKAQII
jgi:hypothetical protein